MKTTARKKKVLQSKRAAAAQKAPVKTRANQAAAKTAAEAGGAPDTAASSVESAGAMEKRLQGPVVSAENISRGVNAVQKVVLEDGTTALFKAAIGEPARPVREDIAPRKMTGIEKARQLFRDAGLSFPTIPEQLATRLKERGRWLFSTRPLQVWPYNLQHYVDEAERPHVKDYAVLSHSGYGVNSYAIQYYLVQGSLHMFLFLGWGGVYMDAKAAEAQIRDCFSIAGQVLTAAQHVAKFETGGRLTVVASDFYGSYWLPPGESCRGKDVRRKDALDVKPLEALTEALGWLRSLCREAGTI